MSAGEAQVSREMVESRAMMLATSNAPTPPRALAAFDAPDLAAALAAASPEGLDALPFGVVALEPGGRVAAYNAAEQRLAGLRAGDVIGRDFFTEVAPCTNNFMVRERFVEAWAAGADLDERVPYTFSFRMRPTRVTLRLLVRGARGWLVVAPV